MTDSDEQEVTSESAEAREGERGVHESAGVGDAFEVRVGVCEDAFRIWLSRFYVLAQGSDSFKLSSKYLWGRIAGIFVGFTSIRYNMSFPPV